MKKEEVLNILTEIKGAFGNKFEINEHTAKTWFKYLGQEELLTVQKRLDRHITSQSFPPTIAELISKGDPELEARRMEIARNKWIAEGNDPDEFVYRPASGA